MFTTVTMTNPVSSDLRTQIYLFLIDLMNDEKMNACTVGLVLDKLAKAAWKEAYDLCPPSVRIDG